MTISRVVCLWILLFLATVASGQTLTERQALVTFWEETDGPNWLHSDGWNSTSSVCTWYGISCNEQGQVVSLQLDSNYLRGTLPASLSRLDQLQFLNIVHNTLTGPIPSSWRQLHQLQSIMLNENQLSGDPFDGLPFNQLYGIGMEQNQFSRVATNIDPSLFWNLQIIQLTDNPLNGEFPAALCGFPAVRGIALNNCGLRGVLPLCLGNLTQLLELNINNNQMTGPFPYLDNIPYFNVLSMENNLFDGELDLETLGYPQVLMASNNSFSSVNRASFLANGGGMLFLDLSFNQFAGSITDLNLDVFGPQMAYINIMGNPFHCAAMSEQCLPSSLVTVNEAVTQRVGDSLLCGTIQAVNPSLLLLVSIDAIGYSQCTCVDGYFLSNTIVNRTQCIACPIGCDCHGGILRECYPSPFHGEWQYALTCPLIGVDETACNPLSTNVSASGNHSLFLCATGYQGRLCSECSTGYYSGSRNCRVCLTGMRIITPVALVVGMILLIVYSLNNTSSSSVGEVNIFLFYVQSLLLLVHTGAVQWPWPTFVGGTDHLSTLASFSLTALECVLPGVSRSGRMLVYLLTPLVYLVLLWSVYWIVPRVRPSAISDLSTWKDRHIRATVTFAQFAYFGVTVRVLDALGCTLYDPGTQQYYLNSDPSISCSAHDYSWLLVLAVLGLILVVIAVPTTLSVLIMHRRHALNSAQNQHRFGSLFHSYRAEYWYFELPMTAWRFLLSLVLAVVPFDQPAVSVLLVCLLLLAGLFVSLKIAPHRASTDNALFVGAYAILFVCFAIAYVVRQAATLGPNSSTWLLYVAMVLSIGYAVLLALICVKTVGQLLKTKLGTLLQSRRRKQSGALKQEPLLDLSACGVNT